MAAPDRSQTPILTRMDTPTLVGKYVRLVALSTDHVAALFTIASKPGVWQWKPNAMTKLADMEEYVGASLADRDAGIAIPFAILQQDSDTVLGCTRFGNVALQHRRLEIGWTFLDPAVWRTAVNSECKRLLLGYAFDQMDCGRVELKTDALNDRSRRAILRLGAQEEGILRSHIVCEDGRVRDTVYFSILKNEWPNVRSFLDERLMSR